LEIKSQDFFAIAKSGHVLPENASWCFCFQL